LYIHLVCILFCRIKLRRVRTYSTTNFDFSEGVAGRNRIRVWIATFGYPNNWLDEYEQRQVHLWVGSGSIGEVRTVLVLAKQSCVLIWIARSAVPKDLIHTHLKPESIRKPCSNSIPPCLEKNKKHIESSLVHVIPSTSMVIMVNFHGFNHEEPIHEKSPPRDIPSRAHHAPCYVASEVID
jgi:hypothetical protein